jgi:hypothetical protein
MIETDRVNCPEGKRGSRRLAELERRFGFASSGRALHERCFGNLAPGAALNPRPYGRVVADGFSGTPDATIRVAHATGGTMRMIRQLLALFVLARICASLAIILLNGASSMLQAVAFTIGLIGLALVTLVIGGMSRSGHASSTACRDLGGRNSGPVTAR